MEIRFCQYCGSRLDENGKCPRCAPQEVVIEMQDQPAEQPEQVPAPAPEPEAEAIDTGEGAETQGQPAEEPAAEPSAASDVPVAIPLPYAIPVAGAAPQQTAMQPAYAVPQNIVAYEAAMSAPAQQPKKKPTLRTVLLILGGIFAAAAIAAFFIFFNPSDIRHFKAGDAAWNAKDWGTAQSEFEQVSDTYYMHAYVEEALRILREENPNDKEAFQKAGDAWSAGQYTKAQSYYKQISSTFYRYDEVEKRLKLIEDNSVYIQMANSTWGRSSTGNWMATWYIGTRGHSWLWSRGIPDPAKVGSDWQWSNKTEWGGSGTCQTSGAISESGEFTLTVTVTIPFYTQYGEKSSTVKSGTITDTFVFQKSDFNKEVILYSKSGYKVTAVVTTTTIKVTYEGNVPTAGGSQAPSATHIIFVRQ